jgi:hypothetical protein
MPVSFEATGLGRISSRTTARAFSFVPNSEPLLELSILRKVLKDILEPCLRAFGSPLTS